MGINRSILPIEILDENFFLDNQTAFNIGQDLMGEYAFAEPFPHIALDDFSPLDMAEGLLTHFPKDPKTHDKVYEKGYGGLHKPIS